MTRAPASREIVSEAVAAAAAAVAMPAAVQDDMFTPPLPFGPTAGLTGSPTQLAQLTEEAERRRKAGRPPGAQNKSTKQLRDWLMRGGVLPQKWMMDWLLMEPEQLAARLKCDVAEAFDRQLRIADMLAPYVMSRMAPSDDKGNAVPYFEFHMGNSAGAGADVPPWELDARKREIAAAAARTIDGQAEDVTP